VDILAAHHSLPVKSVGAVEIHFKRTLGPGWRTNCLADKPIYARYVLVLANSVLGQDDEIMRISRGRKRVKKNVPLLHRALATDALADANEIALWNSASSRVSSTIILGSGFSLRTRFLALNDRRWGPFFFSTATLMFKVYHLIPTAESSIMGQPVFSFAI
jgi:hypothetical protein